MRKRLDERAYRLLVCMDNNIEPLMIQAVVVVVVEVIASERYCDL